jgi:hypothetical protein
MARLTDFHRQQSYLAPPLALARTPAHALSTPSRILAGDRAAAATVAGRRRTSAPVTFLPQPRTPVDPR